MRTITRKLSETATAAAQLYWELARSAASLLAPRQYAAVRRSRSSGAFDCP